MKITEPQYLAVVDECSINLTSNVGKVVAKKGSKPIIRTEKTYDAGISIVAAITGNGEVIYQIKEKRMNSDHFKDFLNFFKRNRYAYSDQKQLQLVLDNALYHHSNTTRKEADVLNINFHFQPAHSPEVNAVEELWRQLRQFLRNQLFFTINHLRMAVHDFFINNWVVNIRIARYLT